MSLDLDRDPLADFAAHIDPQGSGTMYARVMIHKPGAGVEYCPRCSGVMRSEERGDMAQLVFHGPDDHRYNFEGSDA